MTGAYDYDCPDELEPSVFSQLKATPIFKLSPMVPDGSNSDMVCDPAVFAGVLRNPHRHS